MEDEKKKYRGNGNITYKGNGIFRFRVSVGNVKGFFI
jgi:hypothetical protein